MMIPCLCSFRSSFCDLRHKKIPRPNGLGVWWAMRDSNPHWSGYEPPALTVKLMALMTLFQRSVKWLSYPENTQVRFLSH